MHLARSGRIIIRLTKELEEGQIVCDKKSEKLAKVTEMIGPVAHPYASGIPITNNINKYLGKKVFAFESVPATKYKKMRKKRK